MLNKTILRSLFSISVLSVLICGNAYAVASLSIPQGQQEKVQPENTQAAPANTDNAQLSSLLDRSGVDRASIHLQVLMQSNTHFSDNLTPKKPTDMAKKSQAKPASNS
ncbi:hypothetical protein ACO0K7_08285 [Undibacterium sp. Ji67W]|uniref:hypothetical protein n=1 Tax=Undibacterium sp. Ji67W TaxID=3413042 RepID=UPI003BF29635